MLKHRFTFQQLADEMSQGLTQTLWGCLRQLEERQWLLQRLTNQMPEAVTPDPDLEAAIQNVRGWLQDNPSSQPKT